MSEANSTLAQTKDFSVEFAVTEQNRNWLILRLRLWLMRHRLDAECSWQVTDNNTRVKLVFDRDKWRTLFLLDWQGQPYRINTQL